MKNAKFMLGLGVGLILGALLLQIMNMGQGAVNANLGKDEVIEAAKRLGLKIVEPTEKLLTEEEWKQQSETEEKQNNNSQKDTDATNKDTNTSTAPETPKTKTTTPQAPTTPTTPTTAQVDQTQKPASANSPTAKEIKFTIAKGDFLSDVSSGLEKAGVISSAKEFQKEAVAKKVNYKLKIGTYSFTAGEEYSSIISKIAPGIK